MKKSIQAILFLCFCFNLQAQDFKYGKVSIEELKEVSHPIDSSADAAILYKKRHIKFEYRDGFNQVIHVHERIKIYNKEGFDWATKKIRLYNRSSANSENIQTLKGYTYNLENGKIVKEKLQKDGMFEEVANKYWKYKSFTMPNIKEGSVIEYVYEISSPYTSIDDINLQYAIPVNKLDLTVKTPEYLIYNKLLNPRAKYIPRLNMSKKSGPQGYDYMDNVITCNTTNIPALKREPMVDNLNNYRAKLILELSATNYPNSTYKTFATNWEKVTESIYKSNSFGDQLSKTGYFEEDIDALIAGETDVQTRINLIYNYVKSKVKWNDFYGFTTDNGVKKAYKEGVGNVADINLMLVAMLRYAGIQANPVLVSTKNNGIPLFPTRQGFNYVICFVENANFLSLLDATEKNSTINILPTRVLNWQGRVIRESGSSTWIDLLATSISKETISLNVKINPDLSVEGKVRNHMTNYIAMRYRDNFADLSEENHIKNVEENNGELVVENLELKNSKDVLKPLQLTYDYQLDSGIEEIGENLYFSPLLFLASDENPFKQEERLYPIDITFPRNIKYMVNIMLPDGYAVESLPKSEASEFNAGQGKFSYIIKENGKFLQITLHLDLNMQLVLASDYQYFKEFYNLIVEKQAEKVVLKKI